MKWICLVIILFFSQLCQAQSEKDFNKRWFNFKDDYHNKKVYLYWGYSREHFTKSDIHFHGKGYDFTIYDVKAKDIQSPLKLKYLAPWNITVPQYNFKAGYFIKPNFHISFSDDHMKYVVNKNQWVKLSGVIDTSVSKQFAGSYINQDKLITPDFLRFEHTNGLSVVAINLEYLLPIYRSANNKIHFGLNGSVGGVWVVTKTDVKVVGLGIDNDFHISGFTIPVAMGPRLEIGRYFFITSEVKIGYVHLPWVILKNNAQDLADHNFSFIETYTALGFTYPLTKKSRHS